MAWFTYFPGLLLILALVYGGHWAWRRMRLTASSVEVAPTGVTIHNWPKKPVIIPLGKIDRFDQADREGALSWARTVSAPANSHIHP